MKTCLTFLLAGITSLCFSQNRSELTKTYDDNGVTLAISVKGTLNGKQVDFSKSYNVAGMGDEEKENLRLHVLDSLGVGESRVAHAHLQTGWAEPNIVVTIDKDIHKTPEEPEPAIVPEVYHRPFKKEIRMDSENDELYMHYSFEKDGEEFSYEKTVNIKDKSDADRLQIINDYERSIQLPARTIQ